MRSNKSYVDFLGIERNDGNQPVGVPFDIEYKTMVAHIVDRIKIVPNVIYWTPWFWDYRMIPKV